MSAKESLIVALGAGANLSLYGIGVWNGSTVLTDGSLLGPVAQPLADWYLLFATVGMLAGILARAAAACATGANGRFHMQTTLPAVLLATALLFSGLWTSGLPALCATAFCAGWSYACLHMFWMARISLTPEKARSVLPFVLLCSALANAWCASAPLESLHECLAIALLVSAACSVVLLAFDRTHGSPARSDVAARQPRATITPSILRRRYLPAFKRFGEVLFCVVTLQIVAPTMNYLGLMNALDPGTQLGVVCAAQAVAAGVVFLALSRIKGPRCSIQFFKYVTPALILALFPVPFAGYPYSLGMLLAGSCLYFVVVFALFCTDAISLAHRNNLVFELFYAVGLFSLMAFCVALEYVMPLVLRSSNSAELLVVFGVFFCVYVLSMAFVYARRRKQEGAEADRRATPRPNTDDAPVPHPQCVDPAANQPVSPMGPRERAALLQRRHQLSAREAEVLELLLRGKNVPAIADELIISQNTVRSHVKRIYRATDVHTRQQLISYCERMGESGEITQADT